MGAISGREELVTATRAAIVGNVQEVIEFMRSHPDEIDLISPIHNHTPLYGAARNNKVEIIKALLDPGSVGLVDVPPADVNKTCGRSKSTPLHAAAFYNLTDAVRMLLDYNARTDIKNIYGYTPVQEATPEVHALFFSDVDLQNANDDQTEERLAPTPLPYALTFHAGHISANIKGIRSRYDVSTGSIQGETGDRIALLWTQIVFFALEKFFPETEVFDIQPNETQTSWQPQINVGVTVTVAIHLIDRDARANQQRMNACHQVLNTLLGLDVKGWEEIALFNGTPFQLHSTSVYIEDEDMDAKEREVVDIPPPTGGYQPTGRQL